MYMKEISCRVVHNLGNYETETAEFTAVIEYGEDPVDAYDQLKSYVRASLGLRREREK